MVEIIDKIFAEKAVILSDEFHIVSDKFPVSKSHLLALSKKRLCAILLDDFDVLFNLLKLLKEYFQEEYMFFERGNVPFCTSFNGPHCAHVHVVLASEYKKEIIDNLLTITNAEKLDITKLEQISSNEYLLFGNSKNIYVTKTEKKLPKRFIRTFLMDNKLP